MKMMVLVQFPAEWRCLFVSVHSITWSSRPEHNKICGRVGIDLNLWDQFGCQDVPAFEFVVRVLQGVVPVFKPLTFGVNAQLYTTDEIISFPNIPIPYCNLQGFLG